MENLINQQVIETEKSNISVTNTSELSKQHLGDSRPNIIKSGYATLKAPFGTGTHGSFLTPFGAIEYLAGASISELKADFIIKMQPLSHVTLDKLKLKMFAVYVPNSRVWNVKDADAFAGQKEDRYGAKITSPPMATPNGISMVNLAGVPTVGWSTTLWRDSIAYHYYGKDGITSALSYNALYVRGYKAIWNDIFRDKSQSPPLEEFNTSIVSDAERNSIFHFNQPSSTVIPEDWDYWRNWGLMRMSANRNYWNSWRNTVLSQNNPVDNASLFTHVVTQQQIDEFRAQSQNINKTDAEIIAEIRGTYVARQNQCYIIGQKTIDIDISLQPMTSDTQSIHLGADGAISYTFASADIITEAFNAPRDGIIHYLYAVVSPDNSIWQNGINLEHTKSDWADFYRPFLALIKDAPMYSREIHGGANNDIIGYKRRYSEYFRHPVYIRGDFPQFTGIFDPSNPRTNDRGFACVSLDGTSKVSLPSKADWHLLGSTEEIGGSNIRLVRDDKLDIILRRILLVNGGSLNDAIFRRRSEQTFYLYGSVSLTINQPIDNSIKTEMIHFGEE